MTVNNLQSFQDGGVYIYALVDPRTNVIRYVGKTVRPQERERKHLSDARYGKRDPRAVWIRELLSLGLEPRFTILKSVTPAQWVAEEKATIASLRAEGVGLTNVSAGGDEGPLRLNDADCRVVGDLYRAGEIASVIARKFHVSRSCVLVALHSGRCGTVEIISDRSRHPEYRPRGDRHPSRLRPETLVRGEKQPKAKLNDDAIIEIVEGVASGVSARVLADQYHVDSSLILMVVKGTIWAHVEVDRVPAQREIAKHVHQTRHRGFKLNPERAERIRVRLSEGATLRELADEFSVSEATIHLVKVGKIWRVKARA